MAHPSDADGDAENGSVSNTRRQFVVGSAGLVGGLAAGSALSGSALAQEDGSEDDADGAQEEETEEEAAVPENDFEDDVAILNYARTLEFLEASFYKEGLDTIGEEGIMKCGMTGDDDDPLWERAYDELRTIQAHEEAHVEALGAAIENLGGEPVEEPEFDFGLRTEYAEVFLATAVQLEDVGVSAYAGAAPYIENEELLPPALGIHSVEARHAAFLRTLADQTSFPEAVDTARSRSEVLEIAGAFIVESEETEEPEDATETPDGNETDTPDGNESEPEPEPTVEPGNETADNGTTENETTTAIPSNATTTAE